MSAPLRKPKPAARRSRLEIVDDAISSDEAALEAARAKFVELAAAEDAAVREAERANRSGSPYSLGSPAQQARIDVEKLDKTIAGLEKGLLASGQSVTSLRPSRWRASWRSGRSR